jgi:hypothetical protein
MKSQSFVRPREGGDPGAKHSNASKTGPPLPRGRAENIAPSVLAHPILKHHAVGQSLQGKRTSSPVHVRWARGTPAFLSFASPNRGGRRADKALCPARDQAMSGSGRTVVHIGAPAPCGAPTRHLGLYAFDGGRTGPTPSGRRGCPSTARGRGCVVPARGCRSRSAPCERLRKAPLELGSGCGGHRLYFTIRQVLFSENSLTRRTPATKKVHRSFAAPGALQRPGFCVRATSKLQSAGSPACLINTNPP